MPHVVTLDGFVDTHGVQYVGKAVRQPNGRYHSLAIVHGALCKVECRITVDQAQTIPENPEVEAPAVEVGTVSSEGLEDLPPFHIPDFIRYLGDHLVDPLGVHQWTAEPAVANGTPFVLFRNGKGDLMLMMPRSVFNHLVMT